MMLTVQLATLLVVLASAAAFIPDEAMVRRYDVSGLAGKAVRLPCEVDRQNCGDFHSIKWYKGNERVFIFADQANVNRAEGPLLDKTEFHFSSNGSASSLEIFPLDIADEGQYKCEITYLTVREACSAVQIVNLTTYALPTSQRLSFEDGSPIDNNTVAGPFDEDTTLTLVCESGGGKPVAKVTWWRGETQLEGQYSSEVGVNGEGVGRGVVQVALTRHHLGATFTCRAENPVMPSPHLSHVSVDVNVPPLSMDVKGGEGSVLEGDVVSIECMVRGARPPATITWLNGTEGVEDVETMVNVQIESVEAKMNDDTFETRSRLTFSATRYENGQMFSCEAMNAVLENRKEQPMRSELALNVHYAPVVRVSPENITVNESMDVLVFCQYDANPPELTHVYWYQDSNQVDVAGSPDKYGNGNVDHPSLLIKNTTAQDMGDYTCRVKNKIGASEVTNMASVSVQFRPQVSVLMDPAEPVSEDERVNVTLTCDVVRANPDFLMRVRWYLDGELLKELPECYSNHTETDSDLCDIEPSRLLLENVYRDFQGNYSCEGMNEAGWGARSSEAELVVHYPPGRAFVTKQPDMAIKGKTLEMTCSLQDPGQPAATEFQWFRGSRLIPDVTSAVWVVEPVSLETEDTFTCIPVNSEGAGENSTVAIDVLAAPMFIERLPPYLGALMNAEEVSLSCRVECSPLCTISWLKDDLPLLNDTHYTIRTTTLPPDPSSGDLESVLSVLSWRMDMWPDGVLDRDRDNANYTCTSTPNVAGPGVTSNTYFRVEYPPEEILVSQPFVQVVEGEVPPKVECRASSYPEATYVWLHGEGEEAVTNSGVLNLDYPMERSRAGDYECVAKNRHGQMTATTTFDVLYKPECKIDREDKGTGEDAHILLTCRAVANPEDVVFRWRLLNETLTEQVTSDGLTSTLRLPASADSRGTYYCYVNNTIGESIPCIIEKLGDDKIITISAIVAAVIVLVLIICVVIIIICRRQRQAGKYPETPKPAMTSGPKDNGVPNQPGEEDKQTFYENLPFHGMQPPPNKPFLTSLGGSDLEYADVDYATYTYGPIPYKAASVANAQEKKAEQEAEQSGVPVRPPRRKQ